MFDYANIRTVVGDATSPAQRPAIIMHACNDCGVWAKGFVRALSDRWPQPEEAYRQGSQKLGSVTLSRPESDIYVMNLVCQRGVDENRCISPFHLEQCLQQVRKVAMAMPEQLNITPTIVCPRIGSGLGRTPWKQIEPIIQCSLRGLTVFVYDLPGT